MICELLVNSAFLIFFLKQNLLKNCPNWSIILRIQYSLNNFFIEKTIFFSKIIIVFIPIPNYGKSSGLANPDLDPDPELVSGFDKNFDLNIKVKINWAFHNFADERRGRVDANKSAIRSPSHWTSNPRSIYEDLRLGIGICPRDAPVPAYPCGSCSHPVLR